jgi:hypothetical protein
VVAVVRGSRRQQHWRETKIWQVIKAERRVQNL